MKISFIKTAFLTIMSAACISLLLHISGCTGTDIPAGSDLCNATITIQGPDPIIAELCDPGGAVYDLVVNGIDLSDPANKASWVYTWNVSGDLKMMSSPSDPNLVVAPTMSNGGGTISLLGPAADCKPGEGKLVTWASKPVNIIPNKLSVSYLPKEVCFDPKTGTVSGYFTVDELINQKSAVYDWTILPAGAGKIVQVNGALFNQVYVADIKSDFTLNVTKIGFSCSNTKGSSQFMLNSFPACQ
ncbi:hypothetical protein WSM22_44910 [Cytophagales bacterium WSM2-2]|nr:hypothetical protein WSM22_44910 [Cytophagales bacterium WSM2-2]